MATNEQLDEARELSKLSPDVGKRGKGKITLMREEAADVFVEEVKDQYKEVFQVHIEEAKKIKNYQERKDFINRVLEDITEGKIDTHVHLHKHEEVGEVADAKRKLIVEYEAKLKEIKTKEK